MKTDNKIYKHILEVRHKLKQFTFLDIRGEFLDYLIRETGFDKVKVDTKGGRIDLASNDETEKYFFSIENFGVQVDGDLGFDKFKRSVVKLFNLIDGYSKYKISDISRIGTKSSLMVSKRTKGLDATKAIFDAKVFTGLSSVESELEAKIDDTAILLDLQSELAKMHLAMGVVTKKEAMTKFFGPNKIYEDKYAKSHGIYIEVDYYQEDQFIKEGMDIEKVVKENIEELSKKLDNLTTFFWKE